MRLDKESYDKIIEALEAADGEPFEYTGRSQGRSCVAVKVYTPLRWLLDFAAATARNASDTDEVADILENMGEPRTDGFGREMSVLYFPSVEWQEPEDGEDDEDEEPVEVDVQEYTGSHGHDPGGEGQWGFTFGEAGERHPDDFSGRKVFWHNGTYAQAKKAAVAAAREQGKGVVYVMS